MHREAAGLVPMPHRMVQPGGGLQHHARPVAGGEHERHRLAVGHARAAATQLDPPAEGGHGTDRGRERRASARRAELEEDSSLSDPRRTGALRSSSGRVGPRGRRTPPGGTLAPPLSATASAQPAGQPAPSSTTLVGARQPRSSPSREAGQTKRRASRPGGSRAPAGPRPGRRAWSCWPAERARWSIRRPTSARRSLRPLAALDAAARDDVVPAVVPAHPGLVAAVVVGRPQHQRGLARPRPCSVVALRVEPAPERG